MLGDLPDQRLAIRLRRPQPTGVFLQSGGDRDYYVATAADKLFLMPTSPLDPSIDALGFRWTGPQTA